LPANAAQWHEQGMNEMTTEPWFAIKAMREKIAALPSTLDRALGATRAVKNFDVLGRDCGVVPPSQLPSKPGLSRVEGQARLLHDLGSIEAQAMELAVRTLCEYPEAPNKFRLELAELALGEARHLTLCLDRLDALGFGWGHWDVHLTLWQAVAPEDSLLDRILIVHRYLEGAGLDSGESILRRLIGVASAQPAREVVEVIVREEVDHVLFGSRWYREIAHLNKIDPERDFCQRIGKIMQTVPRRDRIARDLRLRAGFSEPEILALEEALMALSN
jgi:uncharacterized ferritin-like protein (DUF455 family)